MLFMYSLEVKLDSIINLRIIISTSLIKTQLIPSFILSLIPFPSIINNPQSANEKFFYNNIRGI